MDAVKIVGIKTVSDLLDKVVVDGTSTEIRGKLHVLPTERVSGDLEMHFTVNLSHFSQDEEQWDITTDAVARMLVAGLRTGKAALADYFSQPGQARQLSLFSNATPEPKKRGRPKQSALSDLDKPDSDSDTDEQPLRASN